MKMITSKRAARREKKKKRLAALADIVKQNDKDREVPVTISDSDSSNETRKATKNKKVSEVQEEPEVKKVKLDPNEESRGSESDISNVTDELTAARTTLTEDQYIQLKKELKERKRKLENVPKFRLRLAGYNASLEVDQEKRTPIFLTDIQHLLMSALIGKKSPCNPDRWCFIERRHQLSHTVVLVLEGVSLYHYLSNEEKFAESNKIFETKLEVVMPANKEGNIIKDLATAPLTNAQAQELIDKYGCLEAAVEMIKDPTLLVNAIFPVDDSLVEEATAGIPKDDKFPRTKLLLSALQMVDEGYPMPLRGELADRFKSFVFTKDKYAPVTDLSPMFAIDCEMCKTSGGQNELTRISIVNEKYETVYETLVMPDNKIIDYLTAFSGITPELMNTVTKRLDEVQREVRDLLPADAILVGQSLNCDLNAMRMMHPYVIDTSVIFNITGDRRRKSKLQTLAMKFLDQIIQKNDTGHDSVEDSLASIRLVKLKLQNNLAFGDEILSQKKQFNDIIRSAMGEAIKNNIFGQANQADKRTAIIKTGDLHPDVKEICSKAQAGDKMKSIQLHEVGTNREAVRKAREIALDNSLTIANLAVDQEKFQLDRMDKTVAKVDKWIQKLWSSVGHNGLFLVLLGGSEDCPSGLLKIAIKKNAADVANAVPITV